MLRRTIRRSIPRLYTSYHQGELHVKQLRHGSAKGGVGFRAQLRSPLYKAPVVAETQTASSVTTEAADEESAEGAEWKDADSVDIVATSETGSVPSTERSLPARPYVPLSDFAQMELKGDYLIEAGQPEAALKFYGVAAKGYSIALEHRPNHSNMAKILIKLSRAFRLTDRLDSAEMNLKKSLEMMENSKSANLEIICETVMELGLTLEAKGDATAGSVYEDVAHLIALYHNIGDSHRFLKNINKLCRCFIINQDMKFQYFSPFDNDRCFALADQALDYAEKLYRKTEQHEGTIRVLETRTQLMDQKLFSMNENSSRIRTMRGRHTRSMNIMSNAPTAQEIFTYSPTVHQVYKDYSLELTAPIGRESEVQPGVNRRIIDDGNARRRKKFYRAPEAREAGSLEKFYQSQQWE